MKNILIRLLAATGVAAFVLAPARSSDAGYGAIGAPASNILSASSLTEQIIGDLKFKQSVDDHRGEQFTGNARVTFGNTSRPQRAQSRASEGLNNLAARRQYD